MAVWLKKIQKKNPQDLTQSKWYLTQEKSEKVGIKDIAKEIEGRSALSLGDVQSVLQFGRGFACFPQTGAVGEP
jgi:hypothetical protein